MGAVVSTALALLAPPVASEDDGRCVPDAGRASTRRLVFVGHLRAVISAADRMDQAVEAADPSLGISKSDIGSLVGS
jgi:hypothetical protein